MIFYSTDLFSFLVQVIVILIISYLIYKRESVIAFERKLWQKIKVYGRAFVWTASAYLAERKKDMFVIIKAPGYEPENKHHVKNDFKSVYREINAENPNSIEIYPNLFMAYDTAGADRNAAPCMTDERFNNIYYGDVVFYAVSIDKSAPRCLTEREAAFVMNYIANYRADKHLGVSAG